MDRRHFLQTGLTAAAAAALHPVAGFSAKDTLPMDSIPIIDTHQHLWDLRRFRLPWTEHTPALKKNFLMDDYLKAVEGLNVVQTVYMEVDLDPAQQQAEAEYVIELCRRDDNPMAAAVVSGRPASEAFAAYVRPFRDSPYIKGIRQVLHGGATPQGYCLQDEFVRGIQLLGELGLSFDICIRPEELADAASLADRCPDTRFILDHCGNQRPERRDHASWRRLMGEVARRENVVCKVSGIVDKASPRWDAEELAPVILGTLEAFGPERVVFGGDWPVCTLGGSLAAWVAALRQVVADRPADQQRKLFHDNALRIYGLKPQTPTS